MIIKDLLGSHRRLAAAQRCCSSLHSEGGNPLAHQEKIAATFDLCSLLVEPEGVFSPLKLDLCEEFRIRISSRDLATATERRAGGEPRGCVARDGANADYWRFRGVCGHSAEKSGAAWKSAEPNQI